MAAWSSDSYSIFMREDYTSKTIAWVKLTATNIFEQLPPQSIIIIKVYHRISLLPNVTAGNLVLLVFFLYFCVIASDFYCDDIKIVSSLARDASYEKFY